MNVRLASITLEVADPQRSKRFYVDALGMCENGVRSNPPDFAYLESAGAALTLASPHTTAAAQPSATIEIGFEVDDLAPVQRRLAELGFTDFAPRQMGWGDVLEGHDSDGYRIVIYQTR